MADFPDLSHLTSEERSIIEGVIMRQRQEEERQNEIMRRKQDEVQVLEETIRARSEKHKKAGIELDATCHICLKTKFADGVGHICNYCNIRCCARCGGKVSLRSNKSIWVCIVCRKKQELLSKSGQWMKSNLNSADNAMLRRMQEDMQGIVVSSGLAEQSQDKRPKLERAHSAAEKENLPLQRSSSVLRRQYSQQEQVPGRRMSASECVVEKSVAPHLRNLPTPHVGSYQTQPTPRHPNAYPDDDPSLYRGELDDLMKQNQLYQKQRQLHQEKTELLSYGHHSEASHRGQVYPQQHSVHQTQGASQACATTTNVPSALPPQKSFSSSEEERTTPECDSDEPDEKGKGCSQHRDGQITRHNGHRVAETMTVDHNGHCPPRELRKDSISLFKRSFRRSTDEWRADSRRFTERRGKKTVRFHGGTNIDSQEEWSWEVDRQGSSQDSATKDSGIDTSSNFTSSEDSNRGDLPKHPNAPWQVSSDGLKMTGQMILRKSGSSGGNILGLKVVGGKLLEDGTMGALIEKVKKGSSADIDGHLKAGDEVLEWNGIPLQGKSFQEVADIIAQSKQEPQVELVVTRNLYLSTTHGGPTSMTTTTTPIASRRLASQTQWKQKNESIPPTPLQLHHKESYETRREKPSVLVTSPGATELHSQGRTRHHRQSIGNANVGGRLQLKTSFDPAALQLVVTLICATGLTPNSNGQPRNPYAKLYLLPDRSEKSKRRTKTLANTNDPRWDQTFVYNGIRCTELRHRALEITVWDYGKYGVNNFLGEVVLGLGSSSLNNELEWHYLMAHEEHRQIGSYQEGGDETIVMSADCHLSPPSTTSRLSDSDTSECDITDYDGSREHRRTADGASISSIGSSSSHYSSPPPEKELCVDGEHRSRRDMLSQGRKRAAFMVRDHPSSVSAYHHYFKEDHHRAMLGHRSLSAAPMDSPSLHYRGRSQSPTGHRSLSPPDHRSIPYSHGYVTRFTSKSATATPTGSPKKRQLPQIPHLHAVLKDRVASDFEERSRFIRHRNRQVHMTYRNTDTGGWEKHYSGLSDSDLPSIGRDHHSLISHAHRLHRSQRGRISSKKDVFNDFGDSDMESVASVTSSAFSTQSERPRASRGLIPTVKNVLIPGVISPMPLPLRRNRRRHRLRVPYSECHCQDYYPAPQSYPSKHNPSLHPLVRSKSAVVRSLYKKMRTCPFTRSQTVDENMLRYESPESEYMVYVLNPEIGLNRSYPADVYFERATRYKPREALRASHNFETGSHRRSRSWQDRSTRTRRPGRVKQQHFFDTTSCSRRRAKEATSDWTSSFDSMASHRSLLVPKARSFEDDIIYNNCSTEAFGRRHLHSESNSSLLSRKARSFEYETVSGNIFSDDSLRTAREKLKKNLSISDSRYGDKIPALKDQSKSYYDSNGETKSKIIADVAKDCFKGSRLTSERARDLRRSRYYFGYDRETSPALDHDLTEFRRFESPIKRSMDALGIIDYESFGCLSQLPEDAFRRKYKHLYYYDDNVKSPCDCHLDRSRFQNAMALREDLYGSQEPSEHIYCSIDELMSPTDRYDKYTYMNDPIDRRKWRTSSWEDSLYDGCCYSLRPGSKRRARSTDSYLDADFNHYENWYVEHGAPYTPYRDLCLASYDNEYFDDSGDEFIDYKTQLSSDMSRNHTNAQFQSDPYDDPLPHYFSPDEYADRTIHDSRPTHHTDHYFESSSPRRRRKRDLYESYYENVPITLHHDDYSPIFAAQPPMTRASSTPILYSDGELESPDYQRRLRLKRRKRNISCPESRDLTYQDEREPLGGFDATSPRLFLDSDDEFGSVETVINRSTGIKAAPELGPRRMSYEEIWSSWPRREPEKYTRQDYDRRRKNSCPECREIEEQYASRRRRHEQDHSHTKYPGQRQRYRRRNSSCPEARELEFYEEDRDRRDVARQQQQQSSKRNVAISDTLEYYEYSMESESQCSENCGFGPSNPRRPRNRAPRPVNANSNIFDSQTATSDTAKNPRATVEHENPASRNHAKPHRSATITPSSGDAFDESSRRRSRKQSTTHDYHDDQLDDDGNNRRSSSMPESSDYASQSSSYEKPSRHELPGNGHAKRGQFSRSFSNTDAPTDEKADGSLSDTAVGLHAEDRSVRGRRSSPGSKSGSGSSSGGTSAVQYQSGMGKKSNSTSQLSATGRKRRLGFGKKGKSSFTVHRSEEVLPEDTASGRSGRQPSSASSDGEGSGDGDSWSLSLRVAGESGNLSEFIEGLGPGQLVGRQVVATPSVGDIQLTLRFNKGQLEIEVVRATKLQRKKGTNTTPAPFVKVYLVNGKKCIAKAKTSPARKTLEPLFQQNLTFRENFKGCILQVTVWGDYGRLEGRKVFMGVAQIMLDKLNLNEMVFGWYKLYGTASL